MSGQELFIIGSVEPLPPVQQTVREMRDSLGLSQEALARELDLSWKTISRYEGEMPPNGGGLLRLIRFAEKKGLEEFAVRFRQAYIQEIGEHGIRRLAAAYEDVLAMGARLSKLARKSRSKEDSQLLHELMILQMQVGMALMGLLPFKLGDRPFNTFTEVEMSLDRSIVGDSEKAKRDQIMREMLSVAGSNDARRGRKAKAESKAE